MKPDTPQARPNTDWEGALNKARTVVDVMVESDDLDLKAMGWLALIAKENLDELYQILYDDEHEAGEDHTDGR